MTYARLLAGIFLFSFSALSYEIVLTRIFSISLWYHFAFMVISIAMLGIGASGTVLSIYQKLKDPSRIGVYGLLLGAAISAGYILSNQIPFDPVRLSWDRIQMLYICLYYLILSLPFFFFGLCIATAFSSISEKSGLLYGADLLGAGIGSISLLCLMNLMGAEKAVIAASTTAMAGAFIVSGRKTRIAAAILILLNIFPLSFPEIIEPRMSPYKGLQLALRYPGAEHIKTFTSPFSRIDIFKSPAVRFAPGLSLTYLDSLPAQMGFSIDGGEVNAITSAENREPLMFLRYLPSALPYEIGKKDDVLILEPKGGLETLLARYSGSKNIYNVDSNPLVIKVIQDNFMDFSGGIYSKNTWYGIGRSWLKKEGKSFDIIDLSLTGASPSGIFGIAEDYRFTVEAFKEYLGYLNDNGILSLNLFIIPPPRTELRLLNTLAASMEEMGISEISSRIIAIRSWGTICILAKRSPFSPEEIEGIKRFSKNRRFDLILLPGIKEEETNIFLKTPSNEYFSAFKDILNPETRKSFQSGYIFDIKPVNDENPFFHYFLKFKNVHTIYRIMGEKWQYFMEEGYLLPVVFIQVLLLSILLIFVPALFRNRINYNYVPVAEGEAANPSQKQAANNRIASVKPRNDTGWKVLPYFAFLGLAFMFVEISLIQKMILPLENPSFAVAAVLASILIASGTGSLLSHRLLKLKSPYTLVAISFLIIVYSFILPSIMNTISPFSMPLKIASVFVLLIPLSLLMGIPFPLGLRSLGETSPGLISWAWAINGCFSVLAPIVTIMLAMAVGFKAVLWTGAGIYFLAFLTFPASSSAHRLS